MNLLTFGVATAVFVVVVGTALAWCVILGLTALSRRIGR